MTNEDLDRCLSRKDNVLPSAGFTARVMETVRSEATAPPPIPFPWKRALPGLVALVLTMGVLLVGLAEGVKVAWSAPMEAEVIRPLLHATLYAGLGPIFFALLSSLAALKLSMRLAAS